MKVVVALVLLLGANIFSQNISYTDNFENGTLDGWNGDTTYNLSEANGEMKIATNAAGGTGVYKAFTCSLTSQLNITDNPYLKVKVKTSKAITIRIDFVDSLGRSTNSSAVVVSLAAGSSYIDLTFNFLGRFSQSYPSSAPVDPSKIKTVVVFFNANSPVFTGDVYFDDLRIGSATGILPPNASIAHNQLGFYPNGPKTVAVANKSTADKFYILAENKTDTVYKGTLGAQATWAPSGDNVKIADFTDLKQEGKYYFYAPEVGMGSLFSISKDVHHKVAKAGMKSFYYQRASTAIESPWGEKWTRAVGLPDNNVLIHNSAATTNRPTGFVVSSPKGWIDAGDYNKYVVNSGVSTYMVSAMYEHYASYFDTLNLNIPESNNNLPDILDEWLWQMDWLSTMQDPDDGGVYFKLTSPNFDGDIMPSAVTQKRYMVKKSTTSALDFAALMAQAARIVKLHEDKLPGLSQKYAGQAIAAWNWARANPNVEYVQGDLTNPTINTGGYGDKTFTDEFQWAAMELYATTKIDSFYTLAGTLPSTVSIPGWQNVRALGYLTLANLRAGLTPIADTAKIKSAVVSLANTYRSAANSSAMRVSMTNGDFYWGSNGVAATQGVILLNAFDITNDSSYYKAAIASMDYIMGRNATGYSFITGYGSNSPMNIHHRISTADGIIDPIPGLIVGGPNTDAQTDCGVATYPSGGKAKSYADAKCSYSTNEIAINWNAPFAYLSLVMEAIQSGVGGNIPYSNDFKVELPVSVSDKIISIANNEYEIAPNPSVGRLTIKNNMSGADRTDLRITDLTGKVVLEQENLGSFTDLDISQLYVGTYILNLKSNKGYYYHKLLKQ